MRVKTLHELMETPGIKFNYNYISHTTGINVISHKMFQYLGTELKDVIKDGDTYNSQYWNWHPWMLILPIPETTIGENVVKIKDGNLHVGCQSLSISDAKLIAKFMEENT